MCFLPYPKGLWFSRHNPSPEQLATAELIISDEVTKLASLNINTCAELDYVMAELRQLLWSSGVEYLYGVFPVPVQSRFDHFGQGFIKCFGAWNVNRAAEGQKPCFEHKDWCLVGYISI